MNTLIKTYVLPALVMVAFTTQAYAQPNQNSNGKPGGKGNAKHPPSNNPGNHGVPHAQVTYKTPSRKVVSVRTLPQKTIIRHNGYDYYYANYQFYTLSGGHYIVIPPRVGFRINVLPPNFRRVNYNNYDYYNANGVFYTQVGSEYEVVNPQVGTIVYELPNDYEKVVIDDETYYEYENILYEKIQVDGTRAYQVVGSIDMN